MVLNDKVRALRGQKKISQQEMAVFLEITQSAYNRIENGLTELKVSDLKKIAEKLEISIHDLLDENVTPTSYNIQTGTQLHYENKQNCAESKDLILKLEKQYQERINYLQAENQRLHTLLEKSLTK